MIQYVAFLRGVSPVNAKMPDLKRCFESAGFTDVKTVLASGNVVFTSRMRSAAEIERKVEMAMAKELDQVFYTIVRSVDVLNEMIAADPYRTFHLPTDAKRVVTFMRQPRKPAVALPFEMDGARILAIEGCEAFTAYVRSPRGPVFMTLIESAFGCDVTTRTWETVKKCVKA
jgi:uncharacterized protein (DUF1697 family)